MAAKTIPRHARALHRPLSVSASQAPGTASPGLPGRRLRADLLTGPVAITERAVVGDRIRRPTAWCEMAACISRYDDPAAAGEADIRARALAAGWRHDGLGRLVCPYCQQRNPAPWATYPLARQDRRPDRGSGQDTGPSRARRLPAAWTALSRWYQTVAGEPGRWLRWLQLLVALAAGANGWNTPAPGPASGAPGRHSTRGRNQGHDLRRLYRGLS